MYVNYYETRDLYFVYESIHDEDTSFNPGDICRYIPINRHVIYDYG